MSSVIDEQLRKDAREIAQAKLAFYIHLAVYAVANTFIFFLWWVTGSLYVSVFPWFVFPLFFWGAGVFVHYACVFIPFSGSGYIEKKTEQEYEKLKEQRRVESVAT